MLSNLNFMASNSKTPKIMKVSSPTYVLVEQDESPKGASIGTTPVDESKIEVLDLQKQENTKLGFRVETVDEKKVRPFLLTTEVSRSASGKKADKKYVPRKESSAVFDVTGKMPRMKIYINPVTPVTVEASRSGIWTTTSTTLPVGQAYTWTLAAGWRSDYLNFTGVFDQYKLDSLEIWLTGPVTENISAGSGTKIQHFSCIDYDNAAVPTTADELTDYSNAQSSPIYQGHYHHFQPHIAVAYYSGAFTSFGNVENQWIDCLSPSVQHYGVRYFCDATPTATQQISFIVRAIVSFRNPR
jgi:hypothetical protein